MSTDKEMMRRFQEHIDRAVTEAFGFPTVPVNTAIRCVNGRFELVQLDALAPCEQCRRQIFKCGRCMSS